MHRNDYEEVEHLEPFTPSKQPIDSFAEYVQTASQLMGQIVTRGAKISYATVVCGSIEVDGRIVHGAQIKLRVAEKTDYYGLEVFFRPNAVGGWKVTSRRTT